MTSHSPTSPSGPGRPVDPDKLERILDAVLESFADGDLHLTIEGVARRAGVSKGTVYRHFENAEALLKATLARQHRKMVGPVPLSADSIEGLREQLVSLGLQLLDFMTSDHGVRIMRTVIAHGAKHGKLGSLIFHDGPEAFVRCAADCLQSAAMNGQIEVEEPLLAAEQLVGMWKGSLVTGLWMNGRAAPDQAEKRHRVESAVNLLLRALRSKA